MNDEPESMADAIGRGHKPWWEEPSNKREQEEQDRYFLRHQLEQAFSDVLDAMLQTNRQKRVDVADPGKFKVKGYVMQDTDKQKMFRIDVTLEKRGE